MTQNKKKPTSPKGRSAREKQYWNRRHEFQWHKKTKTRKGHPSYIFGSSKNRYKFVCFTHSSTTDGKENIKLKHNIASDETEDCYVRPVAMVDRVSNFEKPLKKYRIHKEDAFIIKELKKQK